MTYKEVVEQFGIKINNESLFIDAFTHASYSNEKKNGCVDYERIEFVGDSVLGLVIATLIYKTYPRMKQGVMTKLRASLVCSSSLAEYAKKYHFTKAIRIGNGEIVSGGPNQKILEDVFEAFIGATYLDQGFEFTKNMIEEIFYEDIQNFDLDELTDYKSKLQEDLQSSRRGNVVYRVVSETGSSQDKYFVVEVMLVLEDRTEIRLGRGGGRNKKLAEEAAAKDAMTKKAGN